MTMPRPLLPILLLLAWLLPAAGAHAAVFPGEVIDGPSPDIVSAGDVDIARDGTGAVAYVKRDGGVEHVFASLLVDGVFTAPQRLDASLPAAGGSPVVAASGLGRLAVAYVNGGQLYVAVKPAANQPFLAPQLIGGPASDPSIDMSVNGAAWLSFTSAGDVRVATMPRTATQFGGLPDVLDVNQPDLSGEGTGRSRVAVSADGAAVVVFGEAGRVIGRRVFVGRISTAPQDLTLPDLGGLAGGAADLPAIDIEDDSSFAWAVFRQRFADGHTHAIARRLVGSAFEAPVAVDGQPVPGTLDVTGTEIALNGRGEGLVATGVGANAFGAVLHDDVMNPAGLLNPGNGVGADPVAAFGEANEGYVAHRTGTSAADAGVLLSHFDVDLAKRTIPGAEPAQAASNPALGPVDAAAGLDLAIDRLGDGAAVFVQDGADGRRLVAGIADRPPGGFEVYTTSRVRGLVRPTLSWAPATDLFGGVSYTVTLDDQPIATTRETRVSPSNPIPDGPHTIQVTATDRRGQAVRSKPRTVRVDSVAPRLTFTVGGARRRGGLVTVTARVSDGTGAGVAAVSIDFGDRTVIPAAQASHRYGRAGTFTVRVVAQDKAGNSTTVKRQIRIAKKAKATKKKRKG